MTARLEIERHCKDHILFSQGDLGKKYYIILSGECSVLVYSWPVAKLKEGMGFGELGIIKDDSKR